MAAAFAFAFTLGPDLTLGFAAATDWFMTFFRASREGPEVGTFGVGAPPFEIISWEVPITPLEEASMDPRLSAVGRTLAEASIDKDVFSLSV